jgi:hypothetical protein
VSCLLLFAQVEVLVVEVVMAWRRRQSWERCEQVYHVVPCLRSPHGQHPTPNGQHPSLPHTGERERSKCSPALVVM